MFSIDRQKIGLFAVIVIVVVCIAWAGYTIVHAKTPVRVGVLLPLTGDVEVKEPLEWARENINRHGGIGGRPLELVYKDTGTGNTTQLAEELLADDSIRIVIGPPTSDDVYALLPAFAARQKVLISPFATSGDLFRAFGRNGYFWRTPQGDVGQVKTICQILNKHGAKRVALLTENTSYGKTFYDWTGFFATEYGLRLTTIREFERETPGLEGDVAQALQSDPDYIIAICGPTDAATIKREIDRSGSRAKLFLADSAASPPLTSALGAAAEGIEGTTPTADPTTGFTVAYRVKFGHAPTDFAAPVYDALVVAAYTSAREDAVPFELLPDAIRHVVYGNGTRTGWDAQGIHEVIREIRRGGNPDITGASGPLTFDTEFGVDPLVTYYSHWIVEDGEFHTVEVLGSEKTGSADGAGESVSRTRASGSLMDPLAASVSRYVPKENRTDFFAVIVGPSSGWKNYRHQADALAVYTLLRDEGVPDDHIILMVYDDIPYLPENPVKGDVHNIPRGKNLRSGADADYTGSRVTPETLRNVLTGTRTAATPVVLASTNSTDVFVYIASHGAPGDILFSDRNHPFTAEDFTGITDTMYRTGKFRQIVFFVDTCFGESMATNVTTPGLLYFTGAATGEPSLGAVYDMDIRQWLSDEFTANAIKAIREHPDITFRELYITTYEHVTGSHVRMINSENFGNIDVPGPGIFAPMNRKYLIVCAAAGAVALILCAVLITTPVEPSLPVIYMIYGGEKGDLSYIDSAYRGLFSAQEVMPFSKREFAAFDDRELDGLLAGAQPARPGLVIVLGYTYTEQTRSLAERHPDTRFFAIDQSGSGTRNLRQYEITSYGESYLAGVLAATATKTRHVGIILGTQSSLLEGFRQGFRDGARAADPQVVLEEAYVREHSTLGFSDPVRAAEIARAMYRNGTDVIYTVAGFSGTGAIREAKTAPGRYIIGVDSDQAALGPSVVLASAVKRVDRVVYTSISDYLNGSYVGGKTVAGLDDGVTELVYNPRFAHYNTTVSTWEGIAKKEEARYIAGHTEQGA